MSANAEHSKSKLSTRSNRSNHSKQSLGRAVSKEGVLASSPSERSSLSLWLRSGKKRASKESSTSSQPTTIFSSPSKLSNRHGHEIGSASSFLCGVRDFSSSVFFARGRLQGASRLGLDASRSLRPSSCPASRKVSEVSTSYYTPRFKTHSMIYSDNQDVELGAPPLSVEQQSSFHSHLAKEFQVMGTRLALEHENLMRKAEEQLHRLRIELALTKEENRKLAEQRGRLHGTGIKQQDRASCSAGRSSCPELGEDRATSQASPPNAVDQAMLEQGCCSHPVSEAEGMPSNEAALGANGLTLTAHIPSMRAAMRARAVASPAPIQRVGCPIQLSPPQDAPSMGHPSQLSASHEVTSMEQSRQLPTSHEESSMGHPCQLTVTVPHEKSSEPQTEVPKAGSRDEAPASPSPVAADAPHHGTPAGETSNALPESETQGGVLNDKDATADVEACHQGSPEQDVVMTSVVPGGQVMQQHNCQPVGPPSNGQVVQQHDSEPVGLQLSLMPAPGHLSRHEELSPSPRYLHEEAECIKYSRCSSGSVSGLHVDRSHLHVDHAHSGHIDHMHSGCSGKSLKSNVVGRYSIPAQDKGIPRVSTISDMQSQAHGSPVNRYMSNASMSAKGFALWPIWLEQDRVSNGMFGPDSSIFKPLNLSSVFDRNTFLEFDLGHRKPEKRLNGILSPISDFLDMFVVNPTSLKRICWDLFSWVMVGYECTVIPLQFFEMEETSFSRVAMWINRIFWTLDILLSFFTGFQLADGNTTMDWATVAQNYLMTWFLFDICLVSLDWAELISSGAETNLAAARMGKTLKVLRLLRLVRLFRLFRLARVPEAVKAFVSYLQSELTIIVLGIVKIIIFVVVINHFIACAWYGIGNSGEGQTWLEKDALVSRGFWYTYGTAFHWSLTQFAGSMEVHPTNVGERFYAVGVLLFAFVTAASVVSSICSSMTRLHIVTAEQATKVTSLQQFLIDNEISRAVALRVQRNAQHALAEQKRNTPESSIELFALVSEPLQIEVHYEMYIQKLTPHALFSMLAKSSPAMMRGVCHCTVVRLPIMQGDVLFSESEVPPEPTMYFVTGGEMDYHKPGHAIKKLAAGAWASEACVWTPWRHRGTLYAHTDCSLLAFNTVEFQKIARNACEEELDIIRRYGMCFLELLNSVPREELTDLDDPLLVDIENCVREAFPSRPSMTFRNRWRFKSRAHRQCSIVESSEELGGD